MNELYLKKLTQLSLSKEKDAVGDFLETLAKFSKNNDFILDHFHDALSKKKLKISDEWINFAAVMISSGKRSCKIDKKLAFKLYLLSANNGLEHACRNVASCYFYGNGIEIDLDKAQDYCQRSITKNYDPTHRVRNILLGKILFEKENFEEAQKIFEKLKFEDKEHYADALLYLGKIQTKKPNLIGAIELFKQIKNDHPNIHIKALEELTNLYVDARRIFDAIKKTNGDVDSKNIEILEAIADDKSYKLLAEIFYYENNSKQAFIWLNKISAKYQHADKVWEFKKRLLTEQLKEIFPQDSMVTPEEEKIKSISENDESENSNSPEDSRNIEIFVKDSRWVKISDTLEGFTGEKLTKYKKLDDFMTREEVFEKSIEALQFENEIIKEQLTALHKNSNAPEGLIDKLKKHKEQLDSQISHLNEQEMNRLKLQDNWKALTTVEDRRRKRIKVTENRFFDPSRINLSKDNGQFVKKAANHLLENRFAISNESIKPLVIDNQPARRLITSEKALLIAASQYSTQRNIGWRSNDDNKESWQGNYTSGHNCFSNNEIVSLDENKIKIQYKQRTDAKPQRPGDAKVLDITTYGQISNFINSICDNNTVKEKQLAQLMRKFAYEGQPISDEDVKLLLAVDSSSTSSNEDSNDNESISFSPEQIHHKAVFLNQVCYLAFIKEPSEWFESSDAKRGFEWLTVQARAMRLLCEGYLRMNDFFDKNAPYGVFTGIQLINSAKETQEKIMNIHRLYEKWLERHEDAASMAFFKKYNHPDSQVIATRQQHRKELQYLYGGESDTDGEGYDSDGNEEVFKLPTSFSMS